MSELLPLSVSTVLCLVSLIRARGVGGYWLIDPRGASSVLLYLHVSGYLLFASIHDKLPAAFGLEIEHVAAGNWLLVSAQAGFFVGSFVGNNWLVMSMPSLSLTAESESDFLSVLAGATFITALPLVYVFVTSWNIMSSNRYGANQGRVDVAVQYAQWSNVSLIAIPTLVLLLVARGTSNRRILTGTTVGLILMCLFPSLLSGGRKDTFVILVGMFLAWTMRAARRPWREASILAICLALLSTAITKSRGGATLAVEDRLAAVQDDAEKVDVLDQLCLMYAGLPSLTASMSVFPQFVAHTYGRSYFESAVNVTSPAFVTRRYPYTPMAHQFREIYYPHVRGFGFDYALVAEAWQNFGAVGPFCIFCLAGFGLSTLYALGRKRERVNPWLLIYIIALLAVLYGLRTDSNALFKSIAYGTAWIVGLLLGARTLSQLIRRGSDAPLSKISISTAVHRRMDVAANDEA